MKTDIKILLCAALGFTSLDMAADTIVLKDATTIEAYNVEEAGRWVMYTLENSDDAPLQRIALDKVFAIKTLDGELRTVGNTSTATTTQTKQTETESDGPKFVAAVAAPDNETKISKYNTPVLQLKNPKSEKDKEKFCTDFLSIWGITSSSVLSDENIEVSFVLTVKKDSRDRPVPQYKTKVTNKTTKPVYIDLANSFKFQGDGTALPCFSNSVYSESTSGSHGGSLNLGAVAGALGIGGPAGIFASGINVGSSQGKSATVTSAEERILMIPPRGSIYMPPFKYSDGNSICEDYDIYYFCTQKPTAARGLSAMIVDKGLGELINLPGGLDDSRITRDELRAPLGWTREFSEDNTIKTLRRLITYSTSPNFDTYTALDFSLYIRAIMGSNDRWNVPAFYDTKYLECDDESHLIVGIGKVAKK